MARLRVATLLAVAAPLVAVAVPSAAYAASASTITKLSPAVTSTAGGEILAIEGTNLSQVTGVTVDGVPGTDFAYQVSDGVATVAFGAPAHAPGVAQVRLVAPDGVSADAGTKDDLTYETPPDSAQVTKVTPNIGSVSAGNTITLTGSSFTTASGVFFGFLAGTDAYSIKSDTQMTVTVPTQATGTAWASGQTVTVSVTNGNGFSSDNGFADDYTFGADSTAPTAPGTPTVSNITPVGATISWDPAGDSVGVTGYNVTVGGKTTSVTGTSTVISSLAALTNYSVTVTAKDAAGNVSDPSGATPFTTSAAPDTTAPSTPGAITATNITQTGATLSWGASSDNVAVTGYTVTVGGQTYNPTTNSVAVSNLTNGTTYPVTVKAKDAAGNVSAAANGSFKTVTAPDIVAPTTPGTPTISNITQSGATISWTASSDNVGVTGYTVTVGGQTYNPTTNSVAVSNLSAGTTYTVSVVAKDAAGNPSIASSNSFKTTDTTAPSAPGAPTVSDITQTSATVSWAASSDNVGVTAYDVTVAGKTSTVTGTSTSISNLVQNTAYSVSVKARDAAGNVSAASPSTPFTTVKAPDTTAPSKPGTPTTTNITQTGVTISWAASSDDTAVTGYDVTVGDLTKSVTTTSVSFASLTAGTNYTISVVAKDAAGNTSAAATGAFSTTPVPTTPPPTTPVPTTPKPTTPVPTTPIPTTPVPTTPVPTTPQPTTPQPTTPVPTTPIPTTPLPTTPVPTTPKPTTPAPTTPKPTTPAPTTPVPTTPKPTTPVPTTPIPTTPAPASAPTITVLTPPSGTSLGGASLVITGTNLRNTTSVKFGDTEAKSFSVLSDSKVQVTTPQGSGTVDVRVTTTDGGISAITPADRYQFLVVPVGTPVVNSMTPRFSFAYMGGISYVTGRNFKNIVSVTVGNKAAKYFVTSTTSMVVLTPAMGPGTYPFVVKTLAGTSAVTGNTKFVYYWW